MGVTAASVVAREQRCHALWLEGLTQGKIAELEYGTPRQAKCVRDRLAASGVTKDEILERSRQWRMLTCWAQRQRALQLHATGMSCMRISREVDICPQTVWRWCHEDRHRASQARRKASKARA